VKVDLDSQQQGLLPTVDLHAAGRASLLGTPTATSSPTAPNPGEALRARPTGDVEPADLTSGLSAEEQREMDDLVPELADIANPVEPVAAGNPANATYLSVVRASGRLSERTLDAMARQLATGIAIRTVGAYFGMEARRVQYLLNRPDFARRVAHYGARMEAQSAMNLSRLFLEADRVIDNVMAQASNPDAKYFMECTKLVWNQVLPTRNQSEQKIEVNHKLDVQSAMQLSDSIQDLKRTIPHRASVNPSHVTRGSAGIPQFHVTPEDTNE